MPHLTSPETVVRVTVECDCGYDHSARLIGGYMLEWFCAETNSMMRCANDE